MDLRNKSADRDFALKADFLFLETVIFFFRECFATPASLSFASGFNNILFVDQNYRYAVKPRSVMRARTSSRGASRLGTFLRTKRVMSVSTPSFIKAYLA